MSYVLLQVKTLELIDKEEESADNTIEVTQVRIKSIADKMAKHN